MQSRPALKVLLLFVSGILIGKYFNFPILPLLGLGALSFFSAFTLWYADKAKTFLKEICLGAGLILTGILLYELDSGYFPHNHISKFTNNRDPVAILGVIVKYPESRVDKTNLTVEVERIFFKQKVFLVEGRVLVGVPELKVLFQYGDKIVVHGRLKKPRDERNPGEFDYRAYLAAQGIFGIISSSSYIKKVSSDQGSWLLRKVVFPAKTYLDNYVAENLPAQEAGLLRGLLIGERGEIPFELRDAFSKLGVIHILAVSGLHVGFIILIFMGVFSLLRVPYSGRVILTLLGLVFYAYLTNLKPPVVRASTMGGFLLIGSLLERKTDSFNILSLAALILLIFNPLDLFQPGFQLSFAAVASIVYLYPKFKSFKSFRGVTSKFQRNAFIRYFLDLLFVSMAAFLGTLPFTIIYFNRISNFSLLANLLIIPLAFLGLANGLIAAVLNIFVPVLADIYLTTAWFFLHILIKLVEWGSQIPFAHWEIYKFSFIQMMAYFAGLLLVVNFFNFKQARRWLVIYVLLLANLFIWTGDGKGQGELKVTFLDVGQGDAALLTFPDGRNALIDAGPRGFKYDAGKWVVAPYLKREGINEIHALIVSHADSDHLGGVPYIMRNFKVQEVWDNGLEKDTRLFREYLSLVDSLNIKRRIFKTGTVITDFSPVQIYVLHPSQRFRSQTELSQNDASLSLKISYGESDFLFLGDVEQAGEHQISGFEGVLKSEVLKVSHHGSKTSSNRLLLDLVEPELAVISVGEMNRFGHPHAEVVERLNSIQSKILRTDRDAAILLKTDGRKIRQIHWK